MKKILGYFLISLPLLIILLTMLCTIGLKSAMMVIIGLIAYAILFVGTWKLVELGFDLIQ